VKSVGTVLFKEFKYQMTHFLTNVCMLHRYYDICLTHTASDQ